MAPGKIAIVVGAGASVELGFPAGRGLLGKIAGKVHATSVDSATQYRSSSKRFASAVQQLAANERGQFSLGQERAVLKDAYWLASNAPLAPSIDNLLHTHQNNPQIVKIGKALICDCLYDAESASPLMPDTKKRSDFSFLHRQRGDHSATTSWLSRIFWMLAEGSDFDQYLQKLADISFISFNYDRCIEHFLTNAAISYFRLEGEDAKRALDGIQIVHPYGSLGKLRIEGGAAAGFGECEDLANAAKNIRTFTEGMGHESRSEKIKSALGSAERILFLGFGFIPLNMDLLFSTLPPRQVPMIAGTSKGLSPASVEIVTDMLLGYPAFAAERIMSTARKRIALQDMTCCAFLDHNSFALRR
ncbi:hypothetical protein [Gemmobacter caeruleus]|uniref:hypothetical protein n=1 Tax=Gemmobacter caeruleus TaxID=2595004 RepID=UPI0011F00C5D|nr:hypothetical protein [Gemmobacter caeruleus]